MLAKFTGGMGRWPVTFVLVLWPSFGGHAVDIFFLNWLRPRIPAARGVQIIARLAVWFAGGVMIGQGVAYTAILLGALRTEQLPAWWSAGVAMIGVEFIAHFALQLRGVPSFWNGRG